MVENTAAVNDMTPSTLPHFPTTIGSASLSTEAIE